MNPKVVSCAHCGAKNVIARCVACARHFVVTAAHVRGEEREFESEGLDAVPERTPDRCDFCSTAGPARRVKAGLRQKTCASCHTEFLARIGLA